MNEKSMTNLNDAMNSSRLFLELCACSEIPSSIFSVSQAFGNLLG